MFDELFFNTMQMHHEMHRAMVQFHRFSLNDFAGTGHIRSQSLNGSHQSLNNFPRITGNSSQRERSQDRHGRYLKSTDHPANQGSDGIFGAPSSECSHRKNRLALEGIGPAISSRNDVVPQYENDGETPTGWSNLSKGAGTVRNCGAHTVIETTYSAKNPLLYIYQPRAMITKAAFLKAEYVVRLSIKSMGKPLRDNSVNRGTADNPAANTIHALFGFITSNKPYYSVKFDYSSKKLSVLKHSASGEVRLLASSGAPGLKSNKFVPLAIEVSPDCVAISIDDKTNACTYHRESENDDFSGRCGLMLSGKGSKMAFKNFSVTTPGDDAAHGMCRLQSTTPRILTPVVNTETPPRSSSRTRKGDGLKRQQRDEGQNSPSHVGRTFKKASSLSSSDLKSKLPHCDPQFIDLVLSEVIERDLDVSFDRDIAGLEEAKRLLNEAIVLPLVAPQLFQGIRQPWKGCLLFGPPGTGKSLLAKAVAGVNHCTFFNCSASTLVSKYRGDSEKIVRCLFEVARLEARAVIFIDEVDCLVSARSKEEHEASRRLKTEFFTQFDGIASAGTSNVMVLGATNCPWDLDEAARRRFEKRIYIPLPSHTSRRDQFKRLLDKIVTTPDVTPEALATLTDDALGYSGADIYVICREAAMRPVRRLLANLSAQDMAALQQSCSVGPVPQEGGNTEHQSDAQFIAPPVTMEDFRGAVEATKPSVSKESVILYDEWCSQFGSA
jgi:SpoVK/Ycf46/Vps4 family AAA+-type ATPase